MEMSDENILEKYLVGQSGHVITEYMPGICLLSCA